MRTFRRLCCAALLAATAVASVPSPPASADPAGDEQAFAGKLNELRLARGLRPLAVSGDLAGLARTWAGRMQAVQAISHNPALAQQGPAGWRRLGENVGMGYDVQTLHDAFVASPLHYQNMVDPTFDSMGVGVVRAADGRIFVTVNFMTAGRSGPVLAAASAPAAVARPAGAKPRRSCTKSARGHRACRTARRR